MHYVDKCRAVATDISAAALGTARENSKKLGLSDRICFYVGDMFEALEKPEQINEKFDVITVNPPYVKTNEVPLLHVSKTVHEPSEAFDGGGDGLSFYRIIADSAFRYLKKEGIVAAEMGAGQADAVRKIFGRQYFDIQIIRDLSGIERLITAKARY